MDEGQSAHEREEHPAGEGGPPRRSVLPLLKDQAARKTYSSPDDVYASYFRDRERRLDRPKKAKLFQKILEELKRRKGGGGRAGADDTVATGGGEGGMSLTGGRGSAGAQPTVAEMAAALLDAEGSREDRGRSEKRGRISPKKWWIDKTELALAEGIDVAGTTANSTDDTAPTAGDESSSCVHRVPGVLHSLLLPHQNPCSNKSLYEKRRATINVLKLRTEELKRLMMLDALCGPREETCYLRERGTR